MVLNGFVSITANYLIGLHLSLPSPQNSTQRMIIVKNKHKKMTIKVFYYPGRLDTPSWLETHNINRANEQLNPIDFDSYLRAKVADIANRFYGKRRLKVELHRNTSDNRVLIEEIKINNKIEEDAEN